jgi:hypothetical protein
LTTPLVLNCQVILDSCIYGQLAVGDHIADMKAYVLLRGLKQLRHFQLRQPDRASFGAELDAGLAVFGGVENQLAVHGSTITLAP